MHRAISTMSSLIGHLRLAHSDGPRIDVEDQVRRLIYGWRMGTVEPAMPVGSRRVSSGEDSEEKPASGRTIVPRE